MTRAAPPTTKFVAGLCAAGVLCLAAITLMSPGATRMFAWPWTLAYAGAILVPAVALVVRAFDARRPLTLPSRGWLTLGATGTFVILASALASPYRGVSVLASAPLLAGVALFFLAFDGLHADPASAENRHARLRLGLLIAFAFIACTSTGLWFARIAEVGLARALAGRNAFPLGHSNYTAGFALLILPLAGVEAIRRRDGWRIVAATTGVLALVMLFSSGSRGGLIGLVGLAAAGLWAAPLAPGKKWRLTLIGALAGAVFVAANPRTRAGFTGGAENQPLATSDVQRSAMFTAGTRMGADRPLLGWGPGTTPLAYPRYRAGLAGGAENVLQLHSAPVHVWAELGLTGLAGLLGFGALAFRDRHNDPTAAVTLAGYAVFACTDWQLDVPVFGFALATLAALLASPAKCHVLRDTSAIPPRRLRGRLVGALALGGIAVVTLVGRRDPTPELNVRALALAIDPATAERATALLRESLALNPDQEIAHFNLGWLLVVSDPIAAARHFAAAARLVPDKGGVYFGLGLAWLNQGKPDSAARAFALECLNDPSFLSSPWWSEPAITATRDASAAAFADFLRRPLPAAAGALPADQLGRVPAGPTRTYRRTRTGYPVLMRNLDLPPPVDLYDVRELQAASGAAAVALPPKGWLPSPLLLELLDPLTPTIPKS